MEVTGRVVGEMDVERVRGNLAGVRERIEAAGQRGGRTADVRVVAVTKGHGPGAVRAAAASGLTACGENRVQELEAKRAATADLALEWHLIGHLQRNKARRALPLFDLIHSIDSDRLARTLSEEAVRADRQISGLVQVNASGETTKGGFDVASGVDALAAVCELPGLRVCGLMTMAPLSDDETVVRATFRRTHELFERAARDVPGFTGEHLSMGMSSDFEIAVEEGATMVRLGTVLFGERES